MTSPDAPRPRRCFVLTGERAATRAGAARLLSELPTEQALYLGPAELAGASGSARDAKRYLGQSFAAVVLDLHEGLDADLLGQVHGLIRGGGVLVLLTPPAGRAPLDPEGRLAVHPFGPTDVGQRLWGRLQRALRAKAGGPVRFLRPEEAKGQPPLHADDRPLTGTVEQAAVVSQLLDFVVEPGPSAGAAVLTADRGRGKSSALGLLLAALDDSAAGLRIALTGPHRAAVHEVERFAEAAPAFWDPGELGQPGAEPYDLILVDEAAQLSVPLLQRLVQAHPRARWIFATTVHGYEGTGRGFALRFVEWLRALEEERGRSVVELTLREPIRWAPGDPLEALVFDALALDAEPASFEEAPASGLPGDEAAVEVRELDREELAHDDYRLRQLFGLLVQAHYRTTPSDLHRLLDAPNLRVHAALIDGQVVGATLVALEGGLTEAQCAAIAEGKGRIRGHALPDTLISHSGRTAAGELSMVRSVRIVVHPALRRRGIARLLVEHVHRVYEPDLFGTLFGATPELLRFRREVGYEVVRLGASRGARTGEPSVVMLRPVSPRARSLVEGLREDLARDLPLQLALHGFSSSEADDGLDDELAATLAEGLPDAVPLERGARDAAVKSYAFGSRPFESAPAAVKAWVEEHRARLDELPPEEREVITARVLDQQAWLTVARRAGFDTVPPAMRALRRGVRHLW